MGKVVAPYRVIIPYQADTSACFGATTTEMRGGIFIPQGALYMYFQVIATHNPQDFFCGQEPNDLTLTFIVKEDALMETVKQCVIGGYIAIVYPFENKNN